jgi:hypothetical protein
VSEFKSNKGQGEWVMRGGRKELRAGGHRGGLRSVLV